MASAARSSSAEADERLAAYLAPSVVADDLPGLFPLMQHQHLLAAFGALFHGSLAAAQIRLLVLREIGQRSDAPRWSRREIDAHFAYLDPAKLDTVVKRLAEHELLLWDSEDRTYRVSSLGHGALAALSALMQFADGEDAGLGFLAAQLAGGAAAGRIAQDHLAQMLARLTELEEDFAAAVRSGSELQLVAAQERWQSVFLWMEKGTEAIRTLTRDDLLDAAGWRKLTVWMKDYPGVTGDVLFLDLDVVLTGPMDEFWDYLPGDLCIMENYTQRGTGVGNSSVFRFRVGANANIWDQFAADPMGVVNGYDNEQIYLSRVANKIHYWPAAWCRSFKHELLPPWPKIFFEPPALPPGTKVVIFTGKPDPDEARDGKWPGPWYKKLYRTIRPTPWIAEHWR